MKKHWRLVLFIKITLFFINALLLLIVENDGEKQMKDKEKGLIYCNELTFPLQIPISNFFLVIKYC